MGLPTTLLLLCTILLVALVTIHAELYSALVDLQRALNAEQDLAKHLETYVASEEQRLKSVRMFVDQLNNHSSQV